MEYWNIVASISILEQRRLGIWPLVTVIASHTTCLLNRAPFCVTCVGCSNNDVLKFVGLIYLDLIYLCWESWWLSMRYDWSFAHQTWKLEHLNHENCTLLPHGVTHSCCIGEIIIFGCCLHRLPCPNPPTHPPSRIIPEILGFEILPMLLFVVWWMPFMSDKDNHLAWARLLGEQSSSQSYREVWGYWGGGWEEGREEISLEYCSVCV